MANQKCSLTMTLCFGADDGLVENFTFYQYDPWEPLELAELFHLKPCLQISQFYYRAHDTLLLEHL